MVEFRAYGGFIAAETSTTNVVKAIARTARTASEAREIFAQEAIAQFPPGEGYYSHKSGVVDVTQLLYNLAEYPSVEITINN